MLYNKTIFISLTVVVLYLSDQVFGDGLWKGRCGNQTVPMTKVVDGSDVSKDEWPWMVRLKICYGNDCRLCGASLISDEWILTAAHCVNEYKDETKDNIDAYFGDHDQDYDQGDEFRFTIKKKNIHIHENYLNNLYMKNIPGFNDIALLKLDHKLYLNNVHKRLQPVCLPSAKSTLRLNDKCVATGWGRTNPTNAKSHSKILQKVELPIVENAPCSAIYEEYQPDIQLCVGNENGKKDTGKGDSGGPLNCKQANDFWTVDGITSYGIKPPAVYTSVSAYIDWITATMIGYADVDPAVWVQFIEQVKTATTQVKVNVSSLKAGIQSNLGHRDDQLDYYHRLIVNINNIITIINAFGDKYKGQLNSNQERAWLNAKNEAHFELSNLNELYNRI